MERERLLEMIEEIKRIERELYKKKSQLAAAEAMESMTIPGLVSEGVDVEGRKRVFSELIEKIGLVSTGGNSVEEIKKERQR